MMKCEMKDCDGCVNHKVGFAGFAIAACDDHIEIMMDRATDLTNSLNWIRLEYSRMLRGIIPYKKLKGGLND